MMELLAIPLHVLGFVFIPAPYLAILPGVILWWLFRRCRRLLVIVTALTWFCYAGYETMMWLRIWCSGECNIRIDLLLIYPLLIMLTVFSVYSASVRPPAMSKDSPAGE